MCIRDSGCAQPSPASSPGTPPRSRGTWPARCLSSCTPSAAVWRARCRARGTRPAVMGNGIAQLCARLSA
eukprot:9005021-Alexandrium_andersonii.AAC.1